MTFETWLRREYPGSWKWYVDCARLGANASTSSNWKTHHRKYQRVFDRYLFERSAGTHPADTKRAAARASLDKHQHLLRGSPTERMKVTMLSLYAGSTLRLCEMGAMTLTEGKALVSDGILWPPTRSHLQAWIRLRECLIDAPALAAQARLNKRWINQLLFPSPSGQPSRLRLSTFT